MQKGKQNYTPTMDELFLTQLTQDAAPCALWTTINYLLLLKHRHVGPMPFPGSHINAW